MPTPFADRLAAALDASAPICIGLDPVLERLPVEIRSRHADAATALEKFSRGVLDAVRGVAPVVKFQSACYERFGSPGMAVLEEAIDHARNLGLLVILDAKRGDIGISNDHYAAAVALTGAHAVTTSPYLGVETLKSFLAQGLGVFTLVRTSNPEGDAIQSARLQDGRTIAQFIAAEAARIGADSRGERGLSNLGAVVGATKADEGAELRAAMPDQPVLIPGYGAQGGGAAGVRSLIRPGMSSPGDAGILVTASRSVIYPPSKEGWQQDIRDAAAHFAGEITQIIKEMPASA
ncbi:MAG: orotidine-5'-phosphate decarboxylase [Phycisphaeraceae bacterium]|nr:orotidine-5'-phosphate decarboxylase [Phycisphaeraceae bacterium]MCW5754743.1 orotidine-5'-phosphate decarboxylase [Phycisphaeraceae bacterium]